MTDPRQVMRLATINTTLQVAIEVLTPLKFGESIDVATDSDIADALARLRRARERIWHETSRGLDVLERHELELDESRESTRT